MNNNKFKPTNFIVAFVPDVILAPLGTSAKRIFFS